MGNERVDSPKLSHPLPKKGVMEKRQTHTDQPDWNMRSVYELAEVQHFSWIEQDQISPETRQALLSRGWTETGEDLVSPGFVAEMKARWANHDPSEDICDRSDWLKPMS